MINIDKLFEIAISVSIGILAIIVIMALVAMLVKYFPYSIAFIIVAVFASIIAYKFINEVF